MNNRSRITARASALWRAIPLVLLACLAYAADCEKDGDCDDGNACNGGEKCVFDLLAGRKQCADGPDPLCFLACPPLPDHVPVCEPSTGCACKRPEFACEVDADCAAGYVCDSGRCRPRCTSSSGCAPGYECRAGACRLPCKSSSECDDRDPCNGAEVCRDGSCSAGGFQPTCDDRDRCTTDACAPGAKGGSDFTCSHEHLDDCGPSTCTQREIAQPSLWINKPASGAATTAFSVKGRTTLAFPFDPPADPKTSRVRFLIADQLGNPLVDSTVEGVAWGVVAGRGWRANAAGTSWTYTDTTAVVGVTEIALARAADTPDAFDLSVKGMLRTPTPWPPRDMPPVAFLRIEWPSLKFEAQCAEARWRWAGGRSPCTVASATGKLVCETLASP